MTRYQIFCDFDGTIAAVDVTDSLLAAFAPPAWESVEAEWRGGTITARECMARQVALMEVSAVEMDRHLDTIDLDPDFAPFARECQTAGVSLLVLSDGLDYAINRILARHGLPDLPVRANRLYRTGPGQVAFGPGASRESCPQGCCKCAVMAETVAEEDVFSIFIGDGRSDFCGAAKADMVFAKSALLDHCRRQDIPHVGFEDFAQMRQYLAGLLRWHGTTRPDRTAAMVWGA
ncbi:MAG: MtnX-like HAD-IB family phosphatase [Alphaproteobacteria bacterium]|nr:MtnX-like HAD-IB family phosphatase [Alphaproteobacteria bacterium]